MTNNQNYLDIVHKLSRKGYALRDVYRNIQDKDLFLLAYGRLYAHSGAMTPGVDAEDTIDGMSLEQIDAIIEKLKSGTYEWKPVKRVYIPKSKGKKRPIGVTSWNDKLLQEVIRLVLEAYYEPRFSDYSHGFRPNRGCHTALAQIKQVWCGVKWFVEGDIQSCFDEIRHDVILDILTRDIKDNRFLKLIRTMLRAGYMENWEYHKTLSGTPQGSGVSPILANIVLNELDQFVENELLPKYNRGKERPKTPEYEWISHQIQYARKKGNKERVQTLKKQQRQMPSRDPNSPDYRRLRYNRYADDFILGFAGPRCEAETIKEEIRKFLQTLGLELSPEKTLITHALTDEARYLNYAISVSKCNTRMTQRRKDGTRGTVQRAVNYRLVLRVPDDVKRKWQQKYMKDGKTIHRKELTHLSDFEIVNAYGAEFRGIVNYYSLARNVARAFYPVKGTFMMAAAKTLACKHKTKVTRIYRKYKRKSEYGMVALTVEVPNPNNPEKPLRAQLGEKPIRTNLSEVIRDRVYQPYDPFTRNELTRRLLANQCELCGSNEGINVHHVRKLADVQKRYQGRKDPPNWVKFMMSRRRKTVVVCKTCHHQIHNGAYDGGKVE
jgi:group II intron reverse transcriptase/maturase